MERAVWKAARFNAAQLWEMDNIDFYPDCDLAWLLRQDNIATSVDFLVGQFVYNHRKWPRIVEGYCTGHTTNAVHNAHLVWDRC